MPTTKAMKIKVPVAKLIESAEAVRSRIVEEHESALSEFAGLDTQYRAYVIEALTDALARAQEGDLPDFDSYGRGRGNVLYVTINVDRPYKPAARPGVDQVDRDLALLRATTDSELLISTDDKFAGYLS